MRGADVARVARSHATVAGSCAGTPSTMVAAGPLIDREASPAPSNKD